MTSYIDKFRLDNKVAYVVGGLGLIGAEVTRALASVGAKVVVMDLKDKSEKSLESDLNREGYDVVFNHFDCSDLTHIDENFNGVFVLKSFIKRYTNQRIKKMNIPSLIANKLIR